MPTWHETTRGDKHISSHQTGHGQTTTTSSATLQPGPGPKGPNKHITFFVQSFFNAAYNFTFDVLAGDEPPRIVGGYADWTTIKRPLRRSLTMFQGYEPMQMLVTVRFIEFDKNGSWATDDNAGLLIEQKIEILEYMGGESINVGPSPLVYPSTYDNQGNTTPLIPFEYQAATPSVPKIFGGGFVNPWVVTGGITWDPDPVRNNSGFRIHQVASFTLMALVSPGGTPSQTGKARPKAIIFRSRAGADTALKIARQVPTSFPTQLAQAIVAAPQNKGLKLRSINTQIKHGKKVTVPPGN